MAQHIPMEQVDNKALQERARKIKGTTITPYGSMKWQMIEPNRLEYIKGIRVPQSLVCGGQASMEVETDENNIVKEVYLVA